jgi:hypothetical protein
VQRNIACVSMLFTLAIVLLVCAFASSAQAQSVVINDNVQLVNDAQFPELFNMYFLVSKTATRPFGCSCDTSPFFYFADGTLTPRGSSLDEESDWYFVHPGDIFSVGSIADNSFPVLMDWTTVPTTYGQPLAVGTDDFYLGVRTGVGYSFDGFYHLPHRTAYGWVHLQSIGGTLTMLGNVMSYDSSGIIVGTTAVVPEPSTFFLVAIGAISLLGYRKAKT